MKSNVETYIDYFRQLAVQQVDLQHNPLSETGDGPMGGQHFTRCSVDEVLTGLRSQVGWPCLALELYETAMDAPMVYDIKEAPQGAFMVLHHPNDNTFAAETDCYIHTEAIVNDLLRRIYQDHYGFGIDRCQAPFKEFYFSQVSITPVGPVFGGEFGYRVVFGFQQHKTFDITTAPAPGRFLQPAHLVNNDDSYLTDDSGSKLPTG